MLRWAGAFGVLLVGLLAPSCSDSPPSPSAYSGVLAATEFVVGENRFPFGIINVDGAELREASVQVRFHSLAEGTAPLEAEGTAQWREVVGTTPHVHADGTVHQHLEVRGVYVVDSVKLEAPGIWNAEFTASTSSGAPVLVNGLALEVTAVSTAPNVGDMVPASVVPTVREGAKFADLSSHQTADDHMHDYSVAQALTLKRPFVVLFSSPMFCVSRMCGPVTDMAAAVYQRHKGSVVFVHIEAWDLRIARSEGRLVPVEAMVQWKLPSEPWLFVVDAQGKVASRFEGLVSAEESELALRRVLTAS